MHVKVAIAGLGVAAQVIYLPLLARRRELFEVTAVCDLDPAQAESIGRQSGARWFADPAAMLDHGGFDALVVLTPGSHGALVAAALERGLAVLCEKPLAYSQAEARAPGDTTRLMVGYMKQYDPAVRRAVALLAGRPVRHLDVTVLHPTGEAQLAFARVRPSRPSPAALEPWLRADEEALDAALGAASAPIRSLYSGVVLGSLSHDLALMRTFGGPPAGVEHTAVWDGPSLEVCGALERGRYSLRWHYLPRHPAYRETVSVHHEDGTLELVFPSPYLMNAPTVLTSSSLDGTTEVRTVHRDMSEAFERQLEAFHALVTEGTPPLTGLAGGLADIVTAQKIIKSVAGPSIGGEARDA
ncbi:Gfo/Idh/MocA family protein [Streptosporangium roseum]|uniref:Dehydrogenase-like protein n=1 Tax=Streptosporangium roseum (strain ATCC 12428 / DSM 43021 / JCM 3005 / KCTC 9067 / NCIMB 10171 / NRRL 2505 / NI 9100) TaxID=479432 RepID=D2ATV7_STRRD|nr:Gfo/Idh/MocA family oxidoreductase [Streptosporangium roseum]ACZ88612.1 dehydrogenase-like protein [Streptosporangium roseum DSM 43021]